jgi:hypothetical protein
MLQSFAASHNVKTTRDECGGLIVRGKVGHEGYADGRLGVCIMHSTAKKWGDACRMMLAAGMTIRQNGDTEGVATFDPINQDQAKLADTTCVRS